MASTKKYPSITEMTIYKKRIWSPELGLNTFARSTAWIVLKINIVATKNKIILEIKNTLLLTITNILSLQYGIRYELIALNVSIDIDY